MYEADLNLAPPPRSSYLKELRAALDIARLPGAMATSLLQKPQPVRRKIPVILIPGFGAGDRAMVPFRQFLTKAGYACRGWEQGKNVAGLDLDYDAGSVSWDFDRSRPDNGELGVPHLCDRMVRSCDRSHKHERRARRREHAPPGYGVQPGHLEYDSRGNR